MWRHNPVFLWFWTTFSHNVLGGTSICWGIYMCHSPGYLFLTYVFSQGIIFMCLTFMYSLRVWIVWSQETMERFVSDSPRTEIVFTFLVDLQSQILTVPHLHTPVQCYIQYICLTCLQITSAREHRILHSSPYSWLFFFETSARKKNYRWLIVVVYNSCTMHLLLRHHA